MRTKLHVKVGDTVQVTAGNEKGKSGKIVSIDKKSQRAIVEGVNMITKHRKPSAENPQGGIDKGEDTLKAALRELKEETSIISVKLIKEIEGYTTYHLPNHLLGIIWRGKYKGQKQKWFIIKFTGKDEEINLKTKHPEFLEW